MKACNLTDNQKETLRWLVSEVDAGHLKEGEFEVHWYISSSIDDDTILVRKGYQDFKSRQIKESTLVALEKEGCLICYERKTGEYYKGVLAALAYQAISSNFDAPDLSAVPHLIPLTEVAHLDSVLWDRCRYSLSTGGSDPKAWDKAVRTATVVLEERLRKLGKTEAINPNATGEGIVNLIFAGKSPVLSNKLDEKKLKAYRDLYAGMMSVFRNEYIHHFIDPSPETGGAIIVFIDLLLKMLEKIEWDESESSK